MARPLAMWTRRNVAASLGKGCRFLGLQRGGEWAVGDVDETELGRFGREGLLVEARRLVRRLGLCRDRSGREEVEVFGNLLSGHVGDVFAGPRVDHDAADIVAAAAEADRLHAELVLIEEDVPGKQRAGQAEHDTEGGDDEIAAAILFLAGFRKLDLGRWTPVTGGRFFHGRQSSAVAAYIW